MFEKYSYMFLVYRLRCYSNMEIKFLQWKKKLVIVAPNFCVIVR